VDGITYPRLIAEWWQWAYALPLAPYLDPDGSLCELGQNGPVWFLAGTDGSFDARRECDVPVGKHLFVPIINVAQNLAVSRHPMDPAGERDSCGQLESGLHLRDEQLVDVTVLLDGVRVEDLREHHVASDGCFPLYPDVVDDRGPVPMAASDGYWLLIEPLAAGRHTLTVKANYQGFGGSEQGMIQNFEYILWVGRDKSGKNYMAEAGGNALRLSSR
jgi:hypothetical protein